jgi:hypothetical protein
MSKALTILALLISITNVSSGQSKFEGTIREYYLMVTGDSVLQDFQRKYNISIEYNREKLNSSKQTFDFSWISLREAIIRVASKYGFSVEFEDNKAALYSGKRTKKTNNFSGPSTKENVSVSGVVIDKSNGETIPGSLLRIAGSSSFTSSNIDGYFTLLNVPTDTSTIEIKSFGFETILFKLTPSMDLNNIRIEMDEVMINLNAIEISAEREEIMKLNSESFSVVKMSPKKLQQLPNIGEKDLMRSFQLMPGISAANESSSGLYVRGGTPDQNLILYDGFTVYHVDHLYGFFSAFNSNAIKDVQLYKGGFDSKFGGRLSSVTELTGKEGNRSKVSGGAEISLLSFNGYLEGPLGKKTNFLIAARRSYQGALYDKIFESFQNEEESDEGPGGGGGPEGQFSQETKVRNYFYDLNAKITHRPNDKDIFTLSFFNGTDDLDNSTLIETPSFLADQGIDFNFNISDITKYGNIGSSLKWSRKWSNRLYSNNLISFSRYYSDRDQTNSGTISSGGEQETFKFGTIENNNLNELSFRSDNVFQISNDHFLDFGIQASRLDIEYSYAQNDTTTILDRQNNGSTMAFYVSDRFKWQKLTVNPSLRTTLYSETSKAYFEPRFSAGYSLSDKLILKGSIGKFYQFANRITREDILSGSRDFWMLSDGQSIPVSSSTHYIAGLSYELQKYLFSIEGFHKNYSGLSEYSLRFDANLSGINYNENFYTGIGYSKGIEFLAQKKTGLLNGWISYTLSESKNKFDIYGNQYFRANQDVTHEFKVVGIVSLKKWDFSATWIYASGRAYTAPNGAYSVELLDGSQQQYFTVGAKNGGSFPDYHRMDLSANRKLRNAKGEDRGYIGLSLFNLYNRTNTWYKQYSIVNQTIIETDVNYLGLTPNLTLAIKF